MGGSDNDKLMRGRFRPGEGFSSLRPSPFQPDPLPSALLLELKIVATNEMEHICSAKTKTLAVCNTTRRCKKISAIMISTGQSKPALTGYTCHRFLFPFELNV